MYMDLYQIISGANMRVISVNNMNATESRDRSVSIATDCVDDRGSGGSMPGGGWKFILLHRVQTGSGPHPTF
jgi:hypothetical protein